MAVRRKWPNWSSVFKPKRLFQELVIAAKSEVDTALGFDADVGSAKEAVDEAFFDVELGEGVSGFFPFFAGIGAGQLPEIVLFVLLAPVLQVFLKRHVGWRAEIILANAFLKQV